jgi:AcrR family transcriptional regulator
MSNPETTDQRILTSALDLFFSQGIKKTSMEEVAYRAGVTRITIYRYYADKKLLVQAALLRIPTNLEELQAKIANQQPQDIDTVLDALAAQIAGLPKGDFPALLAELQRVYPDVWHQVHTARLKSIQGLFDHLLVLAEDQGRLRSGLNRQVMQAYFIRAVVNVLEDPTLVSQELSASEVFETVKAIFLRGILVERGS